MVAIMDSAANDDWDELYEQLSGHKKAIGLYTKNALTHSTYLPKEDKLGIPQGRETVRDQSQNLPLPERLKIAKSALPYFTEASHEEVILEAFLLRHPEIRAYIRD